MAENGQTLTVGDTIHVSAKITDESGISHCGVHLSGLSILNFEYNDVTERWEAEYTLKASDRDGKYYIWNLNATDIYGNVTVNYNYDNQFIIFYTSLEDPANWPEKTLYLPSNLRRIESSSFLGSTSFEAVFIPYNVNFIADDAFSNEGRLIIFGVRNSAAQHYAESHKNCIFVAVSE